MYLEISYVSILYNILIYSTVYIVIQYIVVVVWKDIHFKSDTNRNKAKGLSFYYPIMLYCRDQMLAVMLLSQHRVSSSKTVRSRAPCSARCTWQAIRTWSAVCLAVPHSQFDEGTKPHLCVDE